MAVITKTKTFSDGTYIGYKKGSLTRRRTMKYYLYECTDPDSDCVKKATLKLKIKE